MSQVKPSVAIPSADQSAELPKHNRTIAISTIYSSTSPKIRELKERYEASHATDNTLAMEKPDIHKSDVSDCAIMGKQNGYTLRRKTSR